MKLGIVLNKSALKIPRKKKHTVSIQIAEKLLRFFDVPIACMYGIFPYNLLSFIIKINHSCIGKYPSPHGTRMVWVKNHNFQLDPQLLSRPIRVLNLSQSHGPLDGEKIVPAAWKPGAVISLVSRWPREFLGENCIPLEEIFTIERGVYRKNHPFRCYSKGDVYKNGPLPQKCSNVFLLVGTHPNKRC